MPRDLKLKTTDETWARVSEWLNAHPECEVREDIVNIMDDLDLAAFEYERADAAADRLGQKWKAAIAANRATTSNGQSAVTTEVLK